MCISHWTPSLLYKLLYYQACNLHVDVQEAALGHLEDEAHLSARGDPFQEALLWMRVSADDVVQGHGQEGSQEHQQLSEHHHGGAGAMEPPEPRSLSRPPPAPSQPPPPQLCPSQLCHPRGLQYSCLENLVDIEAWWASVHRVVKSQPQLKWLNTQACILSSHLLTWNYHDIVNQLYQCKTESLKFEKKVKHKSDGVLLLSRLQIIIKLLPLVGRIQS